MNKIHDQVLIADVGADRALIVTSVIPEDAPADVREGLARRLVVSTGGRCPCGAEMVMPNRQERRAAMHGGEVVHVAIWHESDCPAGEELLTASIERWQTNDR